MNPETCPTCAGEGTLDDGATAREIPCPACAGTGEAFDTLEEAA